MTSQRWSSDSRAVSSSDFSARIRLRPGSPLSCSSWSLTRRPRRRRADTGVYEQQTDQELMFLVQADDAEAFGVLHDRLVRRALFVAHAMNVQNDRVEDVVQEAFLSVWRSRATYCKDRGRVHA